MSAGLRCKGGVKSAAADARERAGRRENPKDLVVYAAFGKAARNWPAHDAIVRTLMELEDGETMIVQSGNRSA